MHDRDQRGNLSIERPPTLSVLVADSIRDGVYNGDLAQGERLQETSLSETYNVSRSTVREALRMLEEAGLVLITPHRGAHVVRLSRRLIRESYTLRQALEPLAVQLAFEAGSINARLLDSLLNCVQLMERHSRMEQYALMNRAEMDFHRLIIESSGNELLMDALKKPHTYCRLTHEVVSAIARNSHPIAEQHRPILERLREGDLSACRETIVKHLQASQRALLTDYRDDADAIPPGRL